MFTQLDLMRSFLFVPGDRPERYEKAVRSGCDAVVVDLEDAVSPEHKDLAREEVLRYFKNSFDDTVKRFLRINSLKTKSGLKDLLALVESDRLPDGLVIPMVDSPEEIFWLDGILNDRDLPLSYFVVVETPTGLDNVEPIVMASEKIDFIGFGSADFTSQTGSDLSWDALLYARSRIVNAAAIAGIVAIDGVWPEINDEDGLVSETRRIASLGFRGKIAIHPKQVSGIHKAFVPNPSALAFAKEVVDAYEAAEGGVITVQGKMIDEPLVVSARHTIALAVSSSE